MVAWWHHQMETFFRVTGHSAGNSPVTRNFGVFFDLRLNTRLSKQSWGSWFESLSRPLWRHSDVAMAKIIPFVPSSGILCIHSAVAYGSHIFSIVTLDFYTKIYLSSLLCVLTCRPMGDAGAILNYMSRIAVLYISYKTVLWWMPHDLNDN